LSLHYGLCRYDVKDASIHVFKVHFGGHFDSRQTFDYDSGKMEKRIGRRSDNIGFDNHESVDEVFRR
jgi:hypothetical protein